MCSCPGRSGSGCIRSWTDGPVVRRPSACPRTAGGVSVARIHPRPPAIPCPVRFTVVTPSYQQPDWLRLCLASVRDQRPGFPYEHIVQDAGTEGIERLADEPRAEGGPILRLFREPDSGMYDAINRGLDRAEGELCAYLNCDEQYLPGTLAHVSEAFDRHPDLEVLFGDMVLAAPDGQPLSYRRTILPDANHIRLNQLNTPTCATFFRRSVFVAGHRFPAEWRASGDAVWIDGLLRAGVRMGLLGRATSVFYLTGGNLSDDPRAREEMRRWAAAPDAPPAWLRRPSAWLFRLRKWRAGAYRRRDVTVSLYVPPDATRRQMVAAHGVGAGWPRTAT